MGCGPGQDLLLPLLVQLLLDQTLLVLHLSPSSLLTTELLLLLHLGLQGGLVLLRGLLQPERTTRDHSASETREQMEINTTTTYLLFSSSSISLVSSITLSNWSFSLDSSTCFCRFWSTVTHTQKPLCGAAASCGTRGIDECRQSSTSGFSYVCVGSADSEPPSLPPSACFWPPSAGGSAPPVWSRLPSATPPPAALSPPPPSSAASAPPIDAAGTSAAPHATRPQRQRATVHPLST